MGLMMRNFYFPKQWRGDSQQRWKVFLPAARTKNCCFKAHLKTFHSSTLTRSSKAEAYEESTLQEIHNNKKTTGLRTEMILKSTTVSEVQQRITKHMVFYDDRRYKARDICFFDFNWSRKLSSNSIGPENLRSQNRNSRVDTTAR